MESFLDYVLNFDLFTVPCFTPKPLSMAGLPALNFGGPSRKTVQDLTEGDHEFSTRPNESVYFINCSDSTLSVNSRSAKVCTHHQFSCQ